MFLKLLGNDSIYSQYKFVNVQKQYTGVYSGIQGGIQPI
jgi:hypothetical protein